MPTTSRQDCSSGTSSQINHIDVETWRQSKELLTSIARIQGEQVSVLFDEGSQVNVISTTTAKRLTLTTKTLLQPRRLLFPNGQQATIQDYVTSLIVTFPAIRLNNEFIRIHFNVSAIVFDTHHEMVLGVPFLRYWNVVSHHCNGSLMVTANSGHHAIIPLHVTRFVEPCRTPFCPIAMAKDPDTPLPRELPFHIDEDNIIATNETPIIINNVATSTPLSGMIQIADDAPISLVSALEFERATRTPEATTYLCVFSAIDDDYVGSKQLAKDPKFAERVKEYAVSNFPQLFPDELPHELPPNDRLHHPIDLTPAHKIPPRKLYRQSEDELKETKRQIYEYLDAGHIRPSSSAFGAPVLLVKKKDGSMRMCIDYRGLNDITIKNNFPLPRIDDLHDRLGKARYFTKLDLYSGYHQIPIRPGDEHKTAFTSRYGTYEFLVMPFGLTNAPATFQTAMNALFTSWLDVFVIVYLDDILIYSATQEEHLKHVHQVMERLTTYKWYCKMKKCEFATTSVEYLGHIVSNGQIAIDPDKMKAVTDWKIPFKNVTEVQSFLGLIGYYRKFIPHFSHIARHLYELTRKNIEFKWLEQHTQAVNALKNAILSPDCLAIFDSSLSTILTTDACDYALGAVLMQQFPQGERPVAFISRTLNNTEQNYSMWEKELFAVVWAIKYFRPYLLNHNFLVKSDNKPSTQLLVNSALKLSTSATNRVIRWILSIQGYSFKVEHQAGKTNVVADALSRFAAHINAMPDDYETAQFCQTQSAPVKNTEISRLFQEAYKRNPACSAILKQLQDGQYHPRLALHEQLIVTRETPFRVMIPDDTALRSALFQEIHDTPLTGHPGFHKFMTYIRRHFVGPHLRRDVLDFTRTCPQCQIAKPRHNLPFGTIMPLQPPEEPWQDISMDLIVHLPHSQIYNAIFVVVDRFSKMAHFIPTQTQISAPELAQIFLDNVVRLHGFPRSIVSDRDTRFLSHFWRELFSLTDTTLRFSTANHPQTDGQTERTNRTLEQYLRIHARHNPTTWSKYLTTAEIAYNNLTHSATGMSPFYLVFQRHANFPLDFAYADLESKNAAVEALLNSRQKVLTMARDNLIKARDQMITHNQHKALPPPFKLHDMVLVHKAAFRTSHHLPDLNKFDDRWFGPYEIIRLVNQNAYALELPQSFKYHNVINIAFLRLYRISTKFPRQHPDSFLLPPVGPDDFASDSATRNKDDSNNDNDANEYEAESILDCRLIKQTRAKRAKQTIAQQLDASTDPNDYEFLVKWKGYPIHDATWEPYNNLKNAPVLINDYITAKCLPDHWRLPVPISAEPIEAEQTEQEERKEENTSNDSNEE